MSTVAFLILFFGVIAAVAGFRLWQNHKAQQKLVGLYDGLPTPTTAWANLLAWFVGPHPQGGASRSVGLPLHPEAIPDGLWRARLPRSTWPNPAFQLHGVSINPGSLAGKVEVYAKVRLTVPDGAVLRPVSFNAPDPEPATPPGLPILVTQGIQRAGDDWSDDEIHELFRFYFTPGTIQLNPGAQSGIYEINAPLDAAALAIGAGNGWTDAQRWSQKDHPSDFELTKRLCEDVFIGFGGGSGLEHGIWLDGPEGCADATIDLLDFRIS